MVCYVRNGSKGVMVKAVQVKLNSLGYYKGKIDSSSGPVTVQAIKNYQKNKRLVVDGCVGPITWKSLFGVDYPNTVKKTATGTTKVLNLAYIEQPDIVTCGCVTGNRLLKNLGVDVSVERLRTLMKTKPYSASSPGTTPDNFKNGIIAAAKEKGKIVKFTAVNLESIKQIKNYIDKGLALGLHGGTIPCMDYKNYYGHYITIIGYDTSKNMVCILDSSRGKKWVSYTCLKQFQQRRGAVNALKIISL
ncbi:MAG: peptidoglycan-binding protein [Methanobacteriaceae archaeon]|nr:peptidoglycan-binding protein [Methanobacteriaceae archaeon]